MNKTRSSFFGKTKFDIWKIKEEPFLRRYIKHLECLEIWYSKMAWNRREMDIPEEKENK